MIFKRKTGTTSNKVEPHTISSLKELLEHLKNCESLSDIVGVEPIVSVAVTLKNIDSTEKHFMLYISHTGSGFVVKMHCEDMVKSCYITPDNPAFSFVEKLYNEGMRFRISSIVVEADGRERKIWG